MYIFCFRGKSFRLKGECNFHGTSISRQKNAGCPKAEIYVQRFLAKKWVHSKHETAKWEYE